MTDWTKTCYVTGKTMSDTDNARFTYEFDAWVSEEGQRLIEESATGSNPDLESEIIYREWYAQDEADAADDANSANDEYRKWHK